MPVVAVGKVYVLRPVLHCSTASASRLTIHFVIQSSELEITCQSSKNYINASHQIEPQQKFHKTVQFYDMSLCLLQKELLLELPFPSTLHTEFLLKKKQK